MPLRYADQRYEQYSFGMYRDGGEEVSCVLLHASPVDQEAVKVVLLESFRCLESGKVIEIQRHQFSCVCEQIDL
jgi:hypothetical protein